MDRAALPYVTRDSNPKVEIVLERIIATADGAFTDSLTFRNTQDGQVTMEPDQLSGKWSVSGTAVTLRYGVSGTPVTGTISGNTLAIPGAAYTRLFVKQ